MTVTITLVAPTGVEPVTSRFSVGRRLPRESAEGCQGWSRLVEGGFNGATGTEPAREVRNGRSAY